MKKREFYSLDNLLSPELSKLRGPQPENWSKEKFFAVSENSGTATIYIYDYIGFWGITPGEIVDQIKDLKAEKIDLRINSPGGNVFDGLAIMNVLSATKKPITGHVDGIAASIASVILMASDKISIAETAKILIHDAWGLVAGDSRELRKTADLLDVVSDDIALTYSKHSNLDKAAIRNLMREETVFSAKKAVEFGFAHNITRFIPEQEEDSDSHQTTAEARVKAEKELLELELATY